MLPNKNHPRGYNPPEFMIHGKARKALQRELSREKQYLKYGFWDLRDLTEAYEGRIIDPETSKSYKKAEKRFFEILLLLEIPYGVTLRK